MKVKALLKGCVYFILGKDILMKYHKKKMISRMNKYGVEAFSAINDVLTYCECSYWLEFGTLLGAYREHGFIKYDTDIDLGMNVNQFSSKILQRMTEKGIMPKAQMVFGDNGRCYKFGGEYKGITIDIHLFDINDNYLVGYVSRPYKGCDWAQTAKLGKYLISQCTFPNNGFKNIKFYGVNVLIPDKTESHLSLLYGSNFMVPIDVDYSQGGETCVNVRLLSEDERIGICLK